MIYTQMDDGITGGQARKIRIEITMLTTAIQAKKKLRGVTDLTQVIPKSMK